MNEKWSKSKILTYGGGGLIALGMLVWFVMLSSGAGGEVKKGDNSLFELAKWPLLICGIGSLLFSIGLWMDFHRMFTRRDQKQVDLVEIEGQIVACKIKNQKGEIVNDRGNINPDKLFYYVCVKTDDGAERELRTIWEIFDRISVGMQGMATLDGNWLGKFVPNRPPVTP